MNNAMQEIAAAVYQEATNNQNILPELTLPYLQGLIMNTPVPPVIGLGGGCITPNYSAIISLMGHSVVRGRLTPQEIATYISTMTMMVEAIKRITQRTNTHQQTLYSYITSTARECI